MSSTTVVITIQFEIEVTRNNDAFTPVRPSISEAQARDVLDDAIENILDGGALQEAINGYGVDDHQFEVKSAKSLP